MDNITTPRQKQPFATGEWSFLILLILALMVLNVPAQWTGIATDPDFTTWVAPLSNRLAQGLRLYDFGGHMPLPPLSYVLLYWLSAGHATWMTESFWNQVAIAGCVLTLFGCLVNVLPRKVALLGAIAALATFTGTDCILFYCSLPNFFSCCLACVGVGYARRAASGRVRGWLAGMGFLGVTALLSKQNVGLFAIAGALLLILLTPGVAIRQRVKDLAFFALVSALSFGALCLVLSPWISIPGMINDVFLTGSECKGGPMEIILKLINYIAEIAALLILTLFVFLVLNGARLSAKSRMQTNLSNDQGSNLNFKLPWIVGVSLAGLACGILLSRMQLDLLPNLYATQTIGLVVCLFAALTLAGLSFRGNFPALLPANEATKTLAALTIVLLPADAGYCLSAPIGQRGFYWNILVIPFLQVALSALVWLVFAGAERLPKNMARIAVTFLMLVFIAQNWQPWRVHWLEIKNCTDTWSNVAWYAGAKVTTNAEPLETLVNKVRSLTKPDDAVLLLPDDPNFEACFDRPRPALNCAIIFTDQYWLRYVSDDVSRLENNLPKLIVIGPRDSWRDYSRLRNNTGAVESLVAQIQTKIFPAHYELVASQKIHYLNGSDYLDVWERMN